MRWRERKRRKKSRIQYKEEEEILGTEGVRKMR